MMEKLHQSQLFFAQAWRIFLYFMLDLMFERLHHAAAEIAVYDGRMHITLAADRWRVAEALGNGLDGFDNILFRLSFRFKRLEFAQHGGGKNSARPGTEILGGEVVACYLAQVVVDISGADGVALAVFIDVLKEFVSRQVAALLYDAREPAVIEVDSVTYAALAIEFEMNG